jgi:CubicO group peptidase (beta-lactamase class C family)
MRAGQISRRAFLWNGGGAAATALILGGMTAPADAANPQSSAASDTVDKYIETERVARGIVGLSVAVVRQGRLVKSGAYGIADLEHDMPVTLHTRFHLDSLSKLFSAVAVMQLVEQGRLNLDDPISRWLPGLQPSWSGITVRNLLTHSSGIVDDYAEEFHGSMLVSYDNATLFEHARSRPLEFKPGDKVKYNNLGFFLLTLIIERASGLPSQTYIEQRVLAPAGLTESGWPPLDDIVPNLAQPYVRGATGVKHFRDYMASQAGFSYSGVSTVLDLARFDTALQSGRLISASSGAEMERPFRLNDGTNSQFGLAWELAGYRGHPTITKTGSSGAALLRFPDRGLTVIALGNVASRWPVISYMPLLHSVAGFYDPALVRNERVDPGIDGAMKSKLKNAVSRFLSGDGDHDSFSRPWLETYTAGDRTAFAEIMAKAHSFEVVACDQVSVPGWTSYGVEAAGTCSVRVVSAAVPAPFNLSFHMDHQGRVIAFDPD